MQKVGIRHGKRGKAVETLINRAPSAGLVTGGRPFGGGRLDGWMVGPCENSPCRGIEITAPCLHFAISTSLRFNWLQNYHCVLSHWIIFPSMSEAHPKATALSFQTGWNEVWNPDKIQTKSVAESFCFLNCSKTYQLCKDKTEKTKEKDREFLYEVKWKDLSPAENTFESVSRCPKNCGNSGVISSFLWEILQWLRGNHGNPVVDRAAHVTPIFHGCFSSQ